MEKVVWEKCTMISENGYKDHETNGNHRDSRTVGLGRRIGRVRFIIHSLLPLLILVNGSEIALRILNLDKPTLHSRPLPGELFYAFQQDPELFWSMRPNVHLTIGTSSNPDQMKLDTNSLGLRCSEVKKKAPNEFRILSLGESTTFGAFVSNDQTYSARLEAHLNDYDRKRSYRVINAGVAAYSSFQSLMYLNYVS